MTNSVQLENGYTRISNEILEVLATTNLNGTQRRILDIVFRQTYGYQRKEHDLSITFIAKATNIHKKQIQRELTALIERKIITVVSGATFNKSRVIAFNKNYNEWLDNGEVAKKLPPNRSNTHTGSEIVPSTGSELATQIKKKENIKENRTNSFSVGANTTKTISKKDYEDFFEKVWKLYPNKKGKSAVSKKSKKAIYELGKDSMVKAINNFKKDLENNPWKDPMYGSTFFNGRYEDYLDESNSGLVEGAEDQAVPTGKIKIMTDEDIEKYNEQLAKSGD